MTFNPTSEYVRQLGERIRRLRLDLGLSQAEVGEQLGVTGQNVSGWERGVSEVAASYLPVLARILKVPLAELVGEANSPVEPEMQDVFGLQGRVVRNLRGAARERYIEALRAQAQASLAMLEERVAREEEEEEEEAHAL